MDKLESHYTLDCDHLVQNNSIGDLKIVGIKLFREIMKSKKHSKKTLEKLSEIELEKEVLTVKLDKSNQLVENTLRKQ